MKGRILGIDYGKARTGLATTDPDQIIVSGLNTVDTRDFREFLLDFIGSNNVVKVVFGKPVHRDGTPTFLWNEIKEEANFISQNFTNIIVDFMDESYTSSMAKSIMIRSGIKKRKEETKKLWIKFLQY